MTLEHSVMLEGLDFCTEYFFYVVSVDSAGNVAVDDNGGLYLQLYNLADDRNARSDHGW